MRAKREASWAIAEWRCVVGPMGHKASVHQRAERSCEEIVKVGTRPGVASRPVVAQGP